VLDQVGHSQLRQGRYLFIPRGTQMSINNYSSARHTTILQVSEDDGGAAAAAAQQAAIETAVAAAVARETAGLKAKNDELLGKLHAANDKVKSFEGLDPTQIKELQTRLEQDDDAKLFAEGKKNVVIEKYTERMRASHAEELAAKDALVAAEAARADSYRQSVLDNEIRAATGGLHKGAVEDALLAARQIFTLDAKGKAVQLDSEGHPVLGKDGKTPFSPMEWIEQQKQLKPHWFPMSNSGGGSGGARGAGNFGADFSNLSPTERLTAARAKGK
jgi:hypothetical protein